MEDRDMTQGRKELWMPSKGRGLDLREREEREKTAHWIAQEKHFSKTIY